jgi:hypothetical protein
VGLGTAPAWSLASPSWVSKDGDAKRALIVVENDGAEALGRTQRRHGGFGEDSTMTWAPGSSTTV